MNKWRFTEYLDKAGYSQAKLATELGICKNTLSNKLNGKTTFNTNEIILVCDKLKIYDPEVKAQIFLC